LAIGKRELFVAFLQGAEAKQSVGSFGLVGNVTVNISHIKLSQ
jgi:hypothetical protein